jgi:hypothetical protein
LILKLLKNARELIGGWRDYGRKPEQRNPWGGPFNDQKARQDMFLSIVATIKPVAIVETGTYRGVSTEFMAKTGLPVHTIEGALRPFGFAWRRLRRIPNVRMMFSDSRRGLVKLAKGPLKDELSQPLFFYLDAHWNDDLPLADELEIIFSRCSDAVVMIDDFRVPDDEGYNYDDYGPGKVLSPDYIRPYVEKFGLVELYPSTPSSKESGNWRRGCAVLASPARAALSNLPLLRRA